MRPANHGRPCASLPAELVSIPYKFCLVQTLRGPAAELSAPAGPHAVAHGDNGFTRLVGHP